jgi:hypothetical protein
LPKLVRAILFCNLLLLPPSWTGYERKSTLLVASIGLYKNLNWRAMTACFLWHSVHHRTETDFYLWVLHPVAHLSNWFLMMTSIATKFQYVNSPFFIFLLTHYMLHFYILYMGPVFTENFNDFTIFIFVLSLITCIGDHRSKYRYKTYNIYASSCVLATDPL